MSGRAALMASQSPAAIARRMRDAVWNPPVQMTGTDTAALIARASGRFFPSISVGGPAALFQVQRASAPEAPRNSRKLANVRSPFEIIVS